MAGYNSDRDSYFGTHYPQGLQICHLFGGPRHRIKYLKYAQRVDILLRDLNISGWAEAKKINPQGELVTLAFAVGEGEDFHAQTGENVEGIIFQRGCDGIRNFYSEKRMQDKLLNICFAAAFYLRRNSAGQWKFKSVLEGKDAACSRDVSNTAMVKYCRFQRYRFGEMVTARVKLPNVCKPVYARVVSAVTREGENLLVLLTFRGSYLFEVPAEGVVMEPVSGSFDDGCSRWVESCRRGDYLHLR